MPERTFKAEGLILRSRTLGESDRLITLLTREWGKFDAVARGARKTKSKLASGVDLFTHGSFDFYRGKTWPVVTSQEAIERFLWFRENPDLYPYGLYLSELTDRLISGEESCPDTFELLRKSWALLGISSQSNLICRNFELKLLQCSGYSPQLNLCTLCGQKDPQVFSPRQGGLVCRECRGAGDFNLDPGTIALARYVSDISMDRLLMLRPTIDQERELDLLVSTFFASHLDLGELKTKKLLPRSKFL